MTTNACTYARTAITTVKLCRRRTVAANKGGRDIRNNGSYQRANRAITIVVLPTGLRISRCAAVTVIGYGSFSQYALFLVGVQ